MPPDYVVGDWCVGFLTACAALLCAWRLADQRQLAGRWLMMLGWMIISIRIWAGLVTSGDVPIHPASLIALAMLACGHCLLLLRTPSAP